LVAQHSLGIDELQKVAVEHCGNSLTMCGQRGPNSGQ
jgi:hypothetical protein